jgi:hypothetical protein
MLLRFRWIAIIVFGLFVAVWLWLGGLSRIIVQYDARQSFLNSREGNRDTDSYSFVTRGLTSGMTESEVDRVMAAASDVPIRHAPQTSPPWDGFVTVYVFFYSPPWHNPITGKDEFLCSEEFWVYFDGTGRAVKVRRNLTGSCDLWTRNNLELDLQPKLE